MARRTRGVGVPPGHHAARLVILAVLAGAAATGALSEPAASGTTWAIDHGVRIVTWIWQPFLPDEKDGAGEPTPSPSATSKPKAKPKPSPSRRSG